MTSEYPAEKSTVCVLLANRIEKLPEIAIKSILMESNSNISIGYLNVSDLVGIPESSRISLIDLRENAIELGINLNSRSYSPFTELEFFRIVQLKWSLLHIILIKNPNGVTIYSDLDVVWIDDVSDYVEKVFAQRSDINALVQDYTSNNAKPELCMGLFAIRNSQESINLISKCASLHIGMITKYPRTGDDDVISQYYLENDGSGIHLLPQSVFPVGNLINAFTSKSLLPGLNGYPPKLFHANFVVGIRKKILLLYIFLKNSGLRRKYFSTFEIVKLELELSLRKFKTFIDRKPSRRVAGGH